MRTTWGYFIAVKLSILCISAISAQSAHIQFDYLVVDEQPKGPIGFTGLGVLYQPEGSPLTFGMRLNNALVGERGGYYTYGYQVGAALPLGANWSFNPVAMFTAGGGAESNDGSGGFGTLAGTLDYTSGVHTFGLGAQYSYISTGVIQGHSVFARYVLEQPLSKPFKRPVHGQAFINTMYSPYNEHDRGTAFIGVGGRSLYKNTFAAVHLNAAVTDLGGYMEVFGGFGWHRSVGPVRLLAELDLGTGGGGRAPAGGGALWGGQAEIQLGHKNFVGLTGGWLSSIGEPFYYSFLALRVGTQLSFQTDAYQEADAYPVYLKVENSIRTYLGPSGFSNIGSSFELYTHQKWSLLGETYWAFTDGRGAYAEGLFGIRHTRGPLYLETQFGAGAGGGINLWAGAGLVFVNAGVQWPLSKSDYAGMKLIRNVYSTTPFPAWGLQFSLTHSLRFKSVNNI